MSNKTAFWQVRADPLYKQAVHIMGQTEGLSDSAVVRRSVVHEWNRFKKEFPEIAEQIRLA